eukprot:9497337-Pyramimonas_sp.AAC.1
MDEDFDPFEQMDAEADEPDLVQLQLEEEAAMHMTTGSASTSTSSAQRPTTTASTASATSRLQTSSAPQTANTQPLSEEALLIAEVYRRAARHATLAWRDARAKVRTWAKAASE